MSKHTPGPWAWYGPNMLCGGERQSDCVLKSADDGKPYGLGTPLIEHHFDGDTAKANARLIAAAPDLLDALRMVLDDPNAFDGRPRTYEIVCKAIAKAEGA